MNQDQATPEISFVIPAYNEAKNLPGCLNSILAEIDRERAQADIVVVNNASTDSTRGVALSFPGVRVVDEPKKGITFARQAGFVASHGRLVANIDADNRLPKGWLRQVLAEFQRHPNLVCLSGPLVYYDLFWLKRVAVWLYNRIVFLVYVFNHRLFKIGSVVQGGNFIVSRASLEKIGGFDTRIRFYGEDTDIALRLSHLGWVKFSLRLFTYSSGRRLIKEGMVATGLRYIVNYYSMIFRHRPATQSYKDIRN